MIVQFRGFSFIHLLSPTFGFELSMSVSVCGFTVRMSHTYSIECCHSKRLIENLYDKIRVNLAFVYSE